MRIRHGLHSPAAATAASCQKMDFLARCVKAWKTYTLKLLLFKYLYGRGTDALCQQQPVFQEIPHGISNCSNSFSLDVLLAAEAAGIRGDVTRAAAAKAAATIFQKAISIDEAAVIIFGRLVSRTFTLRWKKAPETDSHMHISITSRTFLKFSYFST